jgi:hypothetical protein
LVGTPEPFYVNDSTKKLIRLKKGYSFFRMENEIDELRLLVVEFSGKVRPNFVTEFELLHYKVMNIDRSEVRLL